MARDNPTGRRLTPFVAALCGLPFAFPAAAQDGAGPAATRPTVTRTAAPSPNVNVNMINLLVKQGVFTQEQGAALIKEAEDEAYIARQAIRDAATKADGAQKTATDAADAASPPGTKHVVYVPEVVKKELREEIRGEVMTKAQKEGWAAPGKFPEWISRVRFYGDIRARYEFDLFPQGNDPLDNLAVNYNAINTGNPYDTGGANSNPFFWPTYDTNQNRNRARLRGRLGMEADLSEGFWAGLKIGTGDTNAPVSFNQTLGGSGGNFSKYAIWLDRAYIKFNRWHDLAINAGRFDNPFFSPTDLVYHRDLGFDGFAVQATREVVPGFAPFAVAGAFPLFNTDFNAGTNQVGKLKSHDKWMLGAQVGGGFNMVPEIEQKFAIAYYDFRNVQGQLSSPCSVFFTADVCDTDLTRPSFAQKGNTYMALRNILFDPIGNPLRLNQFQFFGLASDFRPLVFSGQIDFSHFNPAHVVLDGEYVWNTAFNRAEVAAKALVNPIPAGATAPALNAPANSGFVGGNLGWLARLTVGYRELKQLGDWNVHVGYKWLDSDAVIDAFTDSDFGLGGTNLKGYFFGANLAVAANVWLSARWMSANQVAGAPYAVDVAQVDLNARF
jgi:hypothetical protein